MGARNLTLAATLFGCTIGSAVHAHLHRVCAAQEAVAAEVGVSELHDAHALYASYKRFAPCDDGALAEGYSEAVARLLVDHWDRLASLLRYTREDPGFERFVVRHIDVTISLWDAQAIHANALTRCPTNARRVCGLMEKATTPGEPGK